MILTRDQYESLRISGRLEETRKPRRRKVQKGALQSVGRDGSIIESDHFVSGCGVKVGDTCEVKWRGEGAKRLRGGIIITAAHIEKDGDHYNVLWTTGPIQQEDYLLARGIGYTKNHEASCDPEASVPYSPDVERVVADSLAAQREARRARLAKLKSATEELAQDEDQKIRRKAQHIDQMAAELKDLIDAA